MKMMSWALPVLAAALVVSGCWGGYHWRSEVPAEMRTVSVPTFRNLTDIAELGPVVSRQLLREIQREGTFKVRAPGDAVLEIQGTLQTASSSVTGYNRKNGFRHAGYALEVEAEVSVVDKRAGRVLIDNRRYRAHAEFDSGKDVTTSKRDASGRLADDLARQVVDDLLTLKW